MYLPQIQGVVRSGRSETKKVMCSVFENFNIFIWVAPTVQKICGSSVSSRVVYYYFFQMCLQWTCTRLQVLLNLWWSYDVLVSTNTIVCANTTQNAVLTFLQEWVADKNKLKIRIIQTNFLQEYKLYITADYWSTYSYSLSSVRHLRKRA